MPNNYTLTNKHLKYNSSGASDTHLKLKYFFKDKINISHKHYQIIVF